MPNYLNKTNFCPLRKDNKQQTWVDHVLSALSRSVPSLSPKVKTDLQSELDTLQASNDFHQLALVSSSRYAAKDIATTLSVLCEALTRADEQVMYLCFYDGDFVDLVPEAIKESLDSFHDESPRYILVEDHNLYQMGDDVHEIPIKREICGGLEYMSNVRIIYMVLYENESENDNVAIQHWLNHDKPLPMITFPEWDRKRIHSEIKIQLPNICQYYGIQADRLMTLPEVWLDPNQPYAFNKDSKTGKPMKKFYRSIRHTIEEQIDSMLPTESFTSAPSITIPEVWLGFGYFGTCITLWSDDENEYGDSGIGIATVNHDHRQMHCT